MFLFPNSGIPVLEIDPKDMTLKIKNHIHDVLTPMVFMLTIKMSSIPKFRGVVSKLWPTYIDGKFYSIKMYEDCVNMKNHALRRQGFLMHERRKETEGRQK